MPKLTALKRFSNGTGAHEVGKTFTVPASEAERLVFLGFAAPVKTQKRKKKED